MEKNLYNTSKLTEAYRIDEKIKGYTTIFNLVEFSKAFEFDLTDIQERGVGGGIRCLF